MSLLTLEVEHLQRQPLNNDDVGASSLDKLLNDWIIADSFESSDSEAQNSQSDHESSFFSQAPNNSTKSMAGDIPNISVAHSQHAREAEQAWQSIRCVQNVDAASLPSPDLYSCTCNSASGAYSISLVGKSEELSSLINRDFPGYIMQMSPISSPKTPLSHLFDLDGFQSLTIQNQSNSATSNSHLRTRNQLSAAIPITAMSTTSQCRSLPSTQKFDRLPVAAPDQYNIMGGGFLSPSQAAQFNFQGLQGSTFDTAIRSNIEQNTELLLSPLENGYIHDPNTPVASPIYSQRSNSQSSLNTPELGGFPSGSTTQPINLNMIKTPPDTQPMEQTGWPSVAAVSSPSYATISSTKAGAWWGTDSAVSLQQANGARSSSVGRVENRTGLGIINGNLNNLNVMSNSMLTQQVSTARHGRNGRNGRNGGSRATQSISLNEYPRLIDLSSVTNDPAYSASALSPHNLMYGPAHMAQQMASQPRLTLPTNYDLLAPQGVRRISNRTSLPACLPIPTPTQATSTKVTKSPRQSHRRSKSGEQHRRKTSNSTSTSPRHVSGFVNFTPHDSQKILTGVAPSGSSKTKARREKEAAEKRRRIGEVVKKAVLKVGGDLRTLEKEGLNELVEGSI
jgi:hypothetical protein